VPSTPQDLQLFAESLARDDRVALEVTANAWEIARILEAHVARVIVVSPSDTGIRQARAKTDRLDALVLARLLAAGSLDAVWTPDEPVRVMRRRLARRSQLITSRSRTKNEVHAVLVHQLKGRPPCSDLFGLKGRAWLAELELQVEERETVDAGPRQIDFLDYLGLDPRVRQSGDAPATSTGASPSRARRPVGTHLSRLPGAPSDRRARYAPSISASARGAGIRSRSSPRPASWPPGSGVC
jgi:transposase